MTWQDLIDTLLSSIPQHRREEQAVFLNEEEQEAIIMDAFEERKMMVDHRNGIMYDCTVGDEKSQSTFVLTP